MDDGSGGGGVGYSLGFSYVTIRSQTTTTIKFIRYIALSNVDVYRLSGVQVVEWDKNLGEIQKWWLFNSKKEFYSILLSMRIALRGGEDGLNLVLLLLPLPLLVADLSSQQPHRWFWWIGLFSWQCLCPRISPPIERNNAQLVKVTSVSSSSPLLLYSPPSIIFKCLAIIAGELSSCI